MTILLLQTLLLGLIFIFLSWLTFYIIGFGILSSHKKNLEDWEIISLSFSLGIIIFVIGAVFFGLLNLRLLVLPILLFTVLYIIIRNKLAIIKPWRIFSKDKRLLSLVTLGILVQGFINFPSGMLYKDGLLFWSSQGHDGLWHVASMEQVKESFPPTNPGFSNELIYNYHYLVDVLMGEFARIFPIFSSLDLYFRFFPILFSFMIGISIFSFMSRWQNNPKIGYWGVFFTYFTGSFGYIVTYFKNGNLLGGETAFWVAQQHTIIGNPPHAISHSLLVSFLLSLLIFIKRKNIFWFLITFAVAATLAGFKVSGGFVMLVGLTAGATLDFLLNRKISLLILTAFLGLSNFATFKLMTRGAESFLIFLPWWFIRTMVVVKLDWIDLELRRQHYIAAGNWHATLRVIQLETTAFLIFVIGNLGMRILGFYEIFKKLISRKFFVSPFEIILFTIMLTGFIVPMIFVQKGIIYNIIQFMQYFLLIFGFYAAVSFYRLLNFLKNRFIKVIVAILVIAFSIPTAIGSLNEFYGPGRTALSKISHSEIGALTYLRENSNSNSVVLTKPFNKYLKDKFDKQPWPIYAWYDTPYVSAISARSSYLASEHAILLDYPGTKQRLDEKGKFFSQIDFSWNKQFLDQAKIDYVYIAKGELEKPIDKGQNNLDIFFENDEIIIFKVIKKV